MIIILLWDQAETSILKCYFLILYLALSWNYSTVWDQVLKSWKIIDIFYDYTAVPLGFNNVPITDLRIDSRDPQTSNIPILKIPLFGRGGISEDLKSILITVWYSSSEVFVHLPCPSSNLVSRSLESTLDKIVQYKIYVINICIVKITSCSQHNNTETTKSISI